MTVVFHHFEALGWDGDRERGIEMLTFVVGEGSRLVLYLPRLGQIHIGFRRIGMNLYGSNSVWA